MSWLFGVKQQNIPDLTPPLGVPPAAPGGGGGEGGDDKGKGSNSKDGQGQHSEMQAYRFDSAALERAAQAAKQLESSSE
jgi:ATPase family AAA domain-containing protein 3A/B